jgi:endonuclease YncB( thermonuclease family)
MSKRTALTLLSAAILGVLVPVVQAGNFTHRGTVTEVVDGDTLDVRLVNGKSERVRIVGIDTPEAGECFGARATARARALALGRRVTLRGDPTQATRDRYGRLLAYVRLPGGRDLGYQLVAGGFARVYVFDDPFKRLDPYRAAERRAAASRSGLWGACSGQEGTGAPTGSAGAGCHPSYTPCVPDVPYDLDCPDIGFTVRVVGSDEYRLDGDADGVGCE